MDKSLQNNNLEKAQLAFFEDQKQINEKISLLADKINDIATKFDILIDNATNFFKTFKQ